MAFDEELRAETKTKIKPVLDLITHVCERLANNRERRAFLKQVKSQAFRLTQGLITAEESERRNKQSLATVSADMYQPVQE